MAERRDNQQQQEDQGSIARLQLPGLQCRNEGRTGPGRHSPRRRRNRGGRGSKPSLGAAADQHQRRRAAAPLRRPRVPPPPQASRSQGEMSPPPNL